MRHSRAYLEKKFDELYAGANAVLKGHNPCQIRGGACYSMRHFPEQHKNEPFCCTGCKHLGPEGCTVESLYCRLWICEPLERLHIKRRKGVRVPDGLVKALRALRKRADHFGLQVFRGTKEDSIAKALRKQDRLGS
jgi:hypothetical protein